RSKCGLWSKSSWSRPKHSGISILEKNGIAGQSRRFATISTRCPSGAASAFDGKVTTLTTEARGRAVTLRYSPTSHARTRTELKRKLLTIQVFPRVRNGTLGGAGAQL